jgi:5'-3' exonuclease
MKYLIFDISNILYRTFYANKNEDETTVAGLAHHSALTTIAKYHREFKPHKIIMCFDRSSWRKEYTKSDDCYTPLVYKGNRRQTMTPKEEAKYKVFLKHLDTFEEIMTDHTSIVTLAADKLEADDLMAGAVQVLSLDPENEMIIVSADKDMMQLLRHDNVRLIDPATGKDRLLTADGKTNKDDYEGDADLFMFEKCLRGDRGDNVSSALPRVRKTRIRKAYIDDYEKANLMNETWKNPEGKEFIVKKMFKENQLLMDLSMQPDYIQEIIIRTVVSQLANPGTFSYFHFMKFLGKYELKKLAQNADTFVTVLSC